MIDSNMLAELPRNDHSLRAPVQRFNIHRHSAYCLRERHGKCRFGYDYMRTRERITLDRDIGKVQYRRCQEGDLKVARYRPYITVKYRLHISVQRAGGVGAIEYIRKYAFKPQ